MPLEGQASAIAASMKGTAGGLALGAGYAAANEVTGFNPLSVMPSPLEGAMYGGFIWNPARAIRTSWRAVSGAEDWAGLVRQRHPAGATIGGKSIGGQFKKGPIKFTEKGVFNTYRGMLGYKTLLLGVPEKGAGLAARASLGNIALSTIEATGKGLTALMEGGASLKPLQVMSNAKKLGLAGMFNLQETNKIGKRGVFKNEWLYKMAGIDIKKGTVVAASGVEKAGALKITKELTKEGLRVGATSMGMRVFSGALGMYSAYAWLQLFGGIAKTLGGIAAEGVGSAAQAFFQYVDEIQRPEFGKGRMHTAMMSAGAATERQRAVRATYGAKINPTNRLFGTEAMYHHSR